jgi:choline dehydrogenase
VTGTASGYPFNYDCNAESAEGASFHDFNHWNGKRVSAADAYLIPAMNRPNLTVRGEAPAGRLILEDEVCRRRAAGRPRASVVAVTL